MQQKHLSDPDGNDVPLRVKDAATFLGSPPPRDGAQHPVLAIGVGALLCSNERWRMARPKKHDGVVYQRPDSKIWWMRFRDRGGERRLESTHTEDWHEAQRALRERLQARDDNTLEIVRKGESLSFGEWAEFFLENYSKPPIRAVKTHAVIKSAVKTLRKRFGTVPLIEVTPVADRSVVAGKTEGAKDGAQKGGYCRATEVGEGDDGASGIPCAASDFQCGCEEEALPGQPLLGGGVPGLGQRPFPAALHELE